jgi:hypothetical protein
MGCESSLSDKDISVSPEEEEEEISEYEESGEAE